MKMQPNNGDNQMRPVMDIQRPTVSAPPQPQPSPNIKAPSGSINRPATMEYTRPRPGDPTAPSFTPTPMQQPNLAESPKPKKSKKVLIIVLFVVLFLGLTVAGAGYYFAVMNKKEPTPAQPVETQPTDTKSDKLEATPEGVDKSVEQIDQSLNSIDDTQDFTSNDISDPSLGM